MALAAETQTLEALKRQISSLSPDDKLSLASYLIDQARSALSPIPSVKTWRELRGIYPYPALGEDAQTWVSRNRQAGDAERA